MNSLTSNTKRPVGRPRADGKAHLDRKTLLLTTAKLIADNGYAGTSIRMIATELDVSTASIFNLFPTKDALLNALIEFVAAPSFEFYGKLKKQEAPAAVVLYKSILEEAKAVLSVDRDYVATFYLPELRKPEFAEAQQLRARMVSHYAALIEQGMRESVFRTVDPDWTAEQVFQLTETSILAGKPANHTEAEARATATAEFCLLGLLGSKASLREITDEASQIDLCIEIDP